MAGDARHVGWARISMVVLDWILFLKASIPIADLQKLAPILITKGYNDEEIAAVFGKTGCVTCRLICRYDLS